MANSRELKAAVKEFDWETFLRNAGLEVALRQDEVGGECFSCHWKRQSFYVNSRTGLWTCHYCGESGGPVSLIANVLEVTWHEAINRLLKNTTINFNAYDIEFDDDDFLDTTPDIELPEDFEELPDDGVVARPYMRYLEKRGVNDSMMRRYRMGYVPSGFYGGRVIVPVYHLGKLVSWVGRAVSRKAEKKIMTPKGNKQGSYLFNLDHLWGRKDIVIVEGVFDALAIPDRAVATFGKKISVDQIRVLQDSGCKSITVCWDDDAEAEVFDVTETYRMSFPEVKYLYLPSGQDPSSIGQEKMVRLLETAVSSRPEMRFHAATSAGGEVKGRGLRRRVNRPHAQRQRQHR